MQDLLSRIGAISDTVWCPWKKVQWDYKLQHLKIVTNGHQYTKTTEDKKFIFWINAHTPIEKKSNQDWNTPIHLESNGQHIKVPLIFWFLIMIFYLCFYHQLWVKWVCIDIGNSSGHIGQTHSRFPKYLWMFRTEWNAHQIDILNNLFNYREPHQHVITTWREKNSIVYRTFNNFVYLKKNFHLLEI